MRAYPRSREEILLIRRFGLGLREKALQLQVMQTRPQTYDAPLTTAQNEQSVQVFTLAVSPGAPRGGDDAATPMEINALEDISASKSRLFRRSQQTTPAM